MRVRNPLKLQVLAGIILTAFLVGVVFFPRPDASRFEIVPIRADGLEWCHPTAINEKGWIAGTCAATDGRRTPFLWKPESGIQALQSSTFDIGRVVDLDEQGRVVGNFVIPMDVRPIRVEAFLWVEGRACANLTPASASESFVAGFTNDGAIAGMVVYATGVEIGSWDESGAWTPHEEYASSGSNIRLQGANTMGDRVGKLGPHPSARAILLRRDGDLVELGVLQGDYSQALDVNDALQVVGLTEAADHEQVAFLWEDGRMTPLETPTNGFASRAYAVNNHGKAVGSLYHPTDLIVGFVKLLLRRSLTGKRDLYENEYAVLWDRGELHYLNHLVPQLSGWDLICAEDINDSGQIVGWGVHRRGEMGYLMTPRPDRMDREPVPSRTSEN